jgi:hypothetical protein
VVLQAALAREAEAEAPEDHRIQAMSILPCSGLFLQRLEPEAVKAEPEAMAQAELSGHPRQVELARMELLELSGEAEAAEAEAAEAGMERPAEALAARAGMAGMARTAP